MNIQLDFFESPTEDYFNSKRLEQCEESLARLRKSQFARLGDMAKEVLKLRQEIDSLRDLLLERRK